jgi:hypothetical protein
MKAQKTEESLEKWVANATGVTTSQHKYNDYTTKKSAIFSFSSRIIAISVEIAQKAKH